MGASPPFSYFLLRGSSRLPIPSLGQSRTIEVAVKVVNEFLQRRMTRKALEFELFHFRIGAVGVPAILSHAVDGSHDAGAVAPSLAVHIYGLVGGIIHKL